MTLEHVHVAAVSPYVFTRQVVDIAGEIAVIAFEVEHTRVTASDYWRHKFSANEASREFLLVQRLRYTINPLG